MLSAVDGLRACYCRAFGVKCTERRALHKGTGVDLGRIADSKSIRMRIWAWALLLLAALASGSAFAQVDLQVTVTDVPDPVATGAQVQYNIGVSNIGAAPAAMVSLDVFYTGTLSPGSQTTPGWTCTVSSVINCTLDSVSLGAGASAPLTLRFTAPSTPQTVQVSATANTASTDNNPTNNTNITQATQVIAATADLNLNIVPSSASAVAGTPVNFTANVSNAGPGNASSLLVNGTLGGAFVFSSFGVSSSWSCSHSNGNVSCNYIGGAPTGTLPNGVSAAPIIINGIAGPSAGTALINLNATSAVTDPTPATASSSILVTAQPPVAVDLSLSKVVIGGQPIPRGVPFTYRLVVSNSSSSTQTASGVQVNDPLDARLSLQSASGAGWTCTGNVLCTLSGSLAIGQSSAPLDLVVIYNGAVSGNTVVGNSATASGAEPDPTPSNNTASASANIRASADLGLSWTGPAAVNVGTSFNVALAASNAGPDTASEVTVAASIPAGFVIGVVTGGAGWSCLVSGQDVSCTRSTLAPGSGQVVGLSLTAPSSAGGPFPFNALASATSFDASSANNAASLNVTVNAPLTGLILLKTDSVDPVAAGVAFDYVLTVTNSGNVGQTGVRIVDTLPGSLSFLSFTGSGWSCTGPGTPGATIVCTLVGSLAPGASSAVRIRVSAEGAGVLTNNAQVTSSQNSTGANATATTTVLEGPALTLVKRARSASVALGNNAVFDLTVGNPGQVDASGLTLIDDLPAGLDFVAASGEGWTCSVEGSRISCQRASLPRGSTSVVAIDTRPRAAGSYSNRAELQATGIAAVVSTDVLTVTASPPPPVVDLSIDLTDSADPVGVGDDFEYRARVRNLGPDVASGVRVTFVLPAGISSLGSVTPGWTCQGGASVECTLGGTLANGGESLLALRVRAGMSGSAIVSANVGGTISDPAQSNNSDSETTTVQAGVNQADLALSASAPASASAGSRVDVSATIRNLGPGPAAAVQLRAQPGSGIAFESGSGSGFSCTASGGVLDCRGGSLAGGASIVLQLQALLATTASGNVTASLSASSTTPDPVAPNNGANLSIAVTSAPPQGADLSITKTDSADPVAYGERFSYTLTVRNAGPAAASGVVIHDPLPSSLSFVSATGVGLACTGGANVACTAAAPLAAGQQLSVQVTVDAPGSAGTINNSASVQATTSDPVAANNSASQSTVVNAPSGEDAEEQLNQGIGGDTIAGDAVTPVVQLCDGAGGQVSALCDALLRDSAGGNDESVNEALRSLYPEEVLSQHASLNQLSATQSFNLDTRMAELRGGGGSGFSLSGLSYISGTQAIPLGLLQGLLDANDEPEVGGTGDLISPWGFFVNGSISRGNQDISGDDREVVTDFDSIGITAGVDYRRSARWVLGGAIGYNKFESSLTDSGALDTKGYTLTGYSAWYLNDSTYVDTRLSWGKVDLDQTRRLRANLTGFALDQTLSSDTQASQFTFAVSAGHHIQRGAWTFTPNGFVRYMRSDVDGFTESGSEFAISFGDQAVKSTVFGAGIQVSRVFSLSNGVLVPSFDFVWNQETGNDDTVIDAAFVGGEPGEFFRLRPEEPDKSYGSFGFGLVYVLANGRQAYLQWRESIGVDGLDRSTVNIGARFEF